MIEKEVPLVGALCNYEVFKAMLDDLDEQCTRKVERRMRRATNRDGHNMCVAEAYSPPRMTAMAKKLGYSAGFALDLATTDENGRPWDLSVKKVQEDALKRLDEEAPWLLTVSPPCTMFSLVQELSRHKQNPEVWRRK